VAEDGRDVRGDEELVCSKASRSAARVSAVSPDWVMTMASVFLVTIGLR
jgi:hypothetical protein